MIDIHGRALIRGIGLYLILYVLHLGVLPKLVGTQAVLGDSPGLLYGINQILGLATCLAPGFIAGKIAQKRGFLHGGLVGGISTILTALMAMVWSIVTGAQFLGLGTIPFWILVNGFLSALGGFLATSQVDLRDDA
jgi:pheromone shutdown protein TraB